MSCSHGVGGIQASASEFSDDALASDRSRLRSYLRQFMASSTLREAVFLASPDLDESVQIWMNEPELGARFRKERESLESIIEAAKGDDDPLSPGFEALKRRSMRL